MIDIFSSFIFRKQIWIETFLKLGNRNIQPFQKFYLMVSICSSTFGESLGSVKFNLAYSGGEMYEKCIAKESLLKKLFLLIAKF